MADTRKNCEARVRPQARLGRPSSVVRTPNTQRRTPKAASLPGLALVELMVLVPLTSILLLLLLGPIGQALNLTSRGQALVAGQDNVRHAQARLYRELTQAMLVHLDRPVNIWQ